MDLKKQAKIHFDSNKDRKEIFATKDGHYYDSAHFANRHCVRNNIVGDDKYTRFTREDFQPIKEAVKKAMPKNKGAK